MKRAIFFMLFSFSFLYGVREEKSTVTIVTNDKVEIELLKEHWKQCLTIKHTKKSHSKLNNNSDSASAAAACAASTIDDESEIKIPLPNISSDILETLTTALEYSYLLQQPEITIPARIQALENFLELVDTPTKLYALITAANYLEAPYLLNLCVHEWSEKEYSPTSIEFPDKLPPEIDIAIAQRMRFSRQLIDDAAQWVADAQTRDSTSLLVETLEPECSSVWSNALSPNGRLIASGHSSSTGNSQIAIHDLETGEFTYIPTPHASISMVQFNQTDTTLLEIFSAGEDGTIQVWDAANGNNLRTFQSDLCRAFVFCHIPQSQLLVADGQDGQGLCVFDLSRDDIRTTTLEGHDDDDHNVLAIETAHDSSQFVSGSGDGTACIWNAATKRLVKKYDHDSGVMAVNLSYSNNRLACGLSNGTVVLHDCTTDQELFSQQEHTEGIWSVLFGNEEDTLLCSGGNDNLIKLWDLRTQRPIRTLDDHSNYIHYMTINPQTQQLFSASHDDTVKVWDLRLLTKPVEELRREFTRDTTVDQLLMLQKANQKTEPFRVDTPPQHRKLFNRFSPRAKQLLAHNLGIVSPAEDDQ